MVQLQTILLFGNVFKSSTICQKFFTEISLKNGKLSSTRQVLAQLKASVEPSYAPLFDKSD